MICVTDATAGIERVTDLQELLARVAAEKQSELSQSIQGGDSISFDNVDIYTPADELLVKELLVKDLSFKIKDGQVSDEYWIFH